MSDISTKFEEKPKGRTLIKRMDYIGLAYALIVASGGAFGYYKSGSTPSLVAGLLFGSAIAYGSFEAAGGNYKPALGAATSLCGLMGFRYYNSGKIMPAGFLAALSLAMAVRYATSMMVAKPMKN